MAKQPIRKFPKIPIFVVENHNEVLEFIYRCLGSRHLPFQNNRIIHFDAHPDLTISNKIPADYVYEKEKLLDAVSIENWIMPAVYAGHFNDVTWIKANFCKQIHDGKYDFKIGDHNGLIRVNSKLEYFVSEGSFQSEKFLSNTRDVHLEVYTLDESIKQPDGGNDSVKSLQQDDSQFILDIDLDFFSTRNPFKRIFNRGTIFEDLKSIYYTEMCDTAIATDNEILTWTEKRLEHLNNLEQFFLHLSENGSLEGYQVPKELERLYPDLIKLVENIKYFYKEEEIDWELFNNAGCTFDSTELPHHESTDCEIKTLIDYFTIFLQKLHTKPIIVTISRSSEDDYCPKEQVEMIQISVLDALNVVYGDDISPEPIFQYKDE